MEIRHGTHPSQIRGFGTADLRAHYLVEDMFPADHVRAVYTHHDRMVVGGAAPGAATPVRLSSFAALRSDCLYVGRGARDVVFEPGGRYYLVSAPAHTAFPTTVSRIADVPGTHLGGPAGANDRTLYKHIHADGIRSCQLVLGVTVLAHGSMRNTMPCHTHDRRTEVYLYFDLPADQRVVHLLGEPAEMRNLIVADEQAVIAPSWSVHCGFGTASYAFVWAMAGENQAFDDMDHVAIPEMR